MENFWKKRLQKSKAYKQQMENSKEECQLYKKKSIDSFWTERKDFWETFKEVLIKLSLKEVILLLQKL